MHIQMNVECIPALFIVMLQLECVCTYIHTQSQTKESAMIIIVSQDKDQTILSPKSRMCCWAGASVFIHQYN